MHSFPERIQIRAISDKHVSAILDDVLDDLRIEASPHSWRDLRDELRDGIEREIEQLGLEHWSKKI